MIMKNVVLTGFMGTGKTSTGKRLACRLGCRFVDTDKLIEDKYQKKISDIFAENGEEYFRDLETAMIKDVLARGHQVIATGGGVVKRAENMAILRENGVIVCLTADIEHILLRTANRGERPVLDKEDQGDRRLAIEKLLSERQPLYAQADFTVNTGDVSPLEVAEEIIGILKREGYIHAKG